MKVEFQKNTPTLHVATELEEIFEVDGASSSKVDVKEKIDVIKAKVQSSTISKKCNDAAELVIILYSIIILYSV